MDIQTSKAVFSKVPGKQIAFIEEPLKISHSEFENYKQWNDEST